MLTIKTSMQLLKFNLSNYTTEKQFKEIVFNHTIDQSGTRLLVRFRHANYKRTVKEIILDTKSVLRIDFTERKFYENFMYYSIENLVMGEVCEC